MNRAVETAVVRGIAGGRYAVDVYDAGPISMTLRPKGEGGKAVCRTAHGAERGAARTAHHSALRQAPEKRLSPAATIGLLALAAGVAWLLWKWLARAKVAALRAPAVFQPAPAVEVFQPAPRVFRPAPPVFQPIQAARDPTAALLRDTNTLLGQIRDQVAVGRSLHGVRRYTLGDTGTEIVTRDSSGRARHVQIWVDDTGGIFPSVRVGELVDSPTATGIPLRPGQMNDLGYVGPEVSLRAASDVACSIYVVEHV